MFYWALGLIAVLCALYFYFTRNYGYWKLRNVVSRDPVPLFGNIYQCAMRKKTYGELQAEIYNEFSNEKVVGMYRMTTPALLVRDLDVIKHIMIKDFDMFRDRGIEFSKEGLGQNLFHADGDTWKLLRSRFTPIFTTGKLRNMLHLMLEKGDKFIDYVDQETIIEREKDIGSLLQMYFISTISACAFGLNIDISRHSKEMETLNRIDKVAFNLNYIFELDMMFPGLLKKFGTSLFPNFALNFFYDLVRQVLKQRDHKPSNRKDFMDLILELKQQGSIQGPKKDYQGNEQELEITDSLMAAQAFVFYAAGYETSTTSLTWLMYELAKNTEIQKKLQEEIDQVLARHNGELSYDALQEMEYLEKVFCENLRMYPIGDPLQRVAQDTYEIPGTDVVIEKGTMVLVPVLGIHHDEKYWPNPHIFDPERFSAAKSANRHSCAFLPFGVGPRNCIGMRFSKISSRVCIAKLLSKYSVEPSKNTPKTVNYDYNRIAHRPGGGVHLNVIPRNK